VWAVRYHDKSHGICLLHKSILSAVMKIPFSVDEFFNVFERYNLSLWPIQLFFYILAFLAVIVILRRRNHSSELVMSILAFFWGWMGVVYHIIYFSSINKAAYLFGIIFLVQSFLFFYFGVLRKEIRFEYNLNLSGVIGLLFIAYALIFYPLIGHSLGHIYPRIPTFGVPCPTTIFTFGILLYSINRIPWYLILVPLLWSIVGFSAALHLSVREDFGLPVAGILATVLLLFYKPKRLTFT
jgi:Family of unknown function (DUF6064)